MRFLHSRALVGIGVVSYGAYIFHLAAGRIVRELYLLAFGQHLHRGPLLFALGAALTLVIAALSWKLFEEPINSLKSRWPYAEKGHPAVPKTDPAADSRS
jgi:peptidoglycan/LPS O-acetylase OafA/YrhL